MFRRPPARAHAGRHHEPRAPGRTDRTSTAVLVTAPGRSLPAATMMAYPGGSATLHHHRTLPSGKFQCTVVHRIEALPLLTGRRKDEWLCRFLLSYLRT